LLPTPSAYESTPTDEYNDEVREHLLDSHRRLYLPGRKWHSQRTLSRMAGALLPTPVTSDSRGLTDGDSREGGASLREIEELLPSPTAWLGRRPENATADPERAASRRHEGARGKRSMELPDALAMLPTPTGQDAANTGGPSQSERNTPPLNAVAPTLLPTPAAADGDGGRLDNAETFKSGKRPSGSKASRTLRSMLHHKLLPTPTAEDGERGQGADAARQWGPSLRGAVQPDLMLPTPRTVANRASRRAMVDESQWASPALEQVAEMAMGQLPREFESVEEVPGASRKLLPTPVVTDSFGSRRSTARTDEWESNPGTTLTDAVWETEGRTTDTTGQPLPGDLTSPRSGAGKPSSGEAHPDQLTIEAG
jgi:hypothetical protein